MEKAELEEMSKKLADKQWEKEREKEHKKDFYCSLCEHYMTIKAPKEFPAKEIVFCEYDITCKNFKLKSK